jgi:hypothetical protein
MAIIDEKALNKIKKCLALSQSSEPHEAAAAMLAGRLINAYYREVDHFWRTYDD